MKKLVIHWFDADSTVEIVEPTLERIAVCRFLEQKGDLVYFLDEHVVEPENLRELEKRAILSALEKANWVQVDAAKMLGLTARNLNYKINQLGITSDKWVVNR